MRTSAGAFTKSVLWDPRDSAGGAASASIHAALLVSSTERADKNPKCSWSNSKGKQARKFASPRRQSAQDGGEQMAAKVLLSRAPLNLALSQNSNGIIIVMTRGGARATAAHALTRK